MRRISWVFVGLAVTGCIGFGDKSYDAELDIVVPQELRDATSVEAPSFVFGGAEGFLEEFAGVLCGPESAERYSVNVGGVTDCDDAPKHLFAWIEPVGPDQVEHACSDPDWLDALAGDPDEGTAYAEHHVSGCPTTARAELVLVPR